MKRFFILSMITFTLGLPAFATNWVQSTPDRAVDMDTIKYDGNYAKVWTRIDAEKYPSYTNIPNVKWIYRLESFENGTNQNFTINEILYDGDMQIIENSMNPFGFAPQTFSDGSSLRTIRDILFK